jgi:serine/threonine protein kinase
LNIVRADGEWKLIDFDAACKVGVTVNSADFKSSSAYCPPEVIRVDETTGKYVVRPSEGERVYVAHSSFDVWSLGCILYQLCHPKALPLFNGGTDDALADIAEAEDSLQTLCAWNATVKDRKLSMISDERFVAEVDEKLSSLVERNKAVNLLSRMLHKDPKKRPSIDQILSHPFISGKPAARMVGEAPANDVFISYRVSSDLTTATSLHDYLVNNHRRLRFRLLLINHPPQNQTMTTTITITC